jgi:hypothetical protein
VLIDGGMADLMLACSASRRAKPSKTRPSAWRCWSAPRLTPLMMAYWFAPLLAGWGRIRPQGAVLQLRRLLRNWRAFLAYGWA